MIASLTLADADGNDVVLHAETGNRAARSVSGLLGVGSLRDSRRVRPSAHGGIDETRFEDGKLIACELEAFSNVSIEDAISEFRAMVKPMLETLDNGPAVLKWTEGASGLELQRTVKLAGEVDPPLQESAAMLVFQAQFYAEDPRAYTQTLTTVQSSALSEASGGLVMPFTFPFTFTPSGGGTATVTNDGNRPTPPVFRIYGYCDSPQIVLVGEDKRIALTGEIAAGDYWEIDVANRTVKTQGGVTQMRYLNPETSTWFELAPGASNLQLIAADFDSSARLDTLLRSAYA